MFLEKEDLNDLTAETAAWLPLSCLFFDTNYFLKALL